MQTIFDLKPEQKEMKTRWKKRSYKTKYGKALSLESEQLWIAAFTYGNYTPGFFEVTQ